jgi:hypothetical protein
MTDDRHGIKPTKIELRRRLDIVESLVIDCASVTEIRRYLAEKEGLNLGRRTIERYVHTVEERIVKAAELRRDVEVQKAKRRLERCYARSMSGDRKNIFAGIAAQKAINGLLGLNSSKKETTPEMNMDAFVLSVIRETSEMERVTLGPLEIRDEILQLLQRYVEYGGSLPELLLASNSNGPSLS